MTRDAILGAIREVSLPPAALPESKDVGIRYPDPLAQFKSMLKAVGGDCLEFASIRQLEEYLKSRFPDPRTRLCGYSGATLESLDPASYGDPHGLKDLDLLVVPGEFGVAENAAIWATPERVPHRVAYFCVQHLVLLLDPKEIVHNMGEAYERVDLEKQPYGVFISGPSKTADIEQCLVIGAHGPRSLTVGLVGFKEDAGPV